MEALLVYFRTHGIAVIHCVEASAEWFVQLETASGRVVDLSLTKASLRNRATKAIAKVEDRIAGPRFRPG